VKTLIREDQDPLIARISALIDVLQGSTIGELDLTEQGTHILIRRNPGLVMITAPDTARPGAQAGRGASIVEDTVAVRAPLTGVFYVASSPGTPPLASVGSLVEAGQVVGIIEAMKVFNEIKSDVAGRVQAIIARDGQLVQKDDPLLLLA
jgi:acetyl-CoA carboxylase biotin carboxyl carrier protein